MWYDGTAGQDPYNGWAIGFASSVDGASWAKWPQNPVLEPGPPGTWDSASVHDPRVLWDGIRFSMWYSGYDGQRWRVGLAVSQDGVAWTRSSGNPVLEVGPPGSWDESGVAYASVFPWEGEYQMWYQGRDLAGRWRIGRAVSKDGMSWRKDPANPVLSPGPNGAWDEERVFTPAVLPWPGGLLMLYGGGPGGKDLGYAFSSDGAGWRRAPGNPALRAVGDAQLLTVTALVEKDALTAWYGVKRGERIEIARAAARVLVRSR